MQPETETLTRTVDGTSGDGDLPSSIERGLLDALCSFRSISKGEAEVFVFTDSTPGHAWKILMEKHATAFGTASFSFSATHLPAPCHSACQALQRDVVESDRLQEVFEVLVDHIACIVNEEEPSPCCFV